MAHNLDPIVVVITDLFEDIYHHFVVQEEEIMLSHAIEDTHFSSNAGECRWPVILIIFTSGYLQIISPSNATHILHTWQIWARETPIRITNALWMLPLGMFRIVCMLTLPLRIRILILLALPMIEIISKSLKDPYWPMRFDKDYNYWYVISWM